MFPLDAHPCPAGPLAHGARAASRVRHLALGLALASCGDLPATLAEDPSPRQALDAWQDPEAWRADGALWCDPRPPPDGQGRPCRHLLQMPPVHAAMVRCQNSGGTADARGRCTCPVGSWQVAGGGCAPRPEVRCTGQAAPTPLAALLAPVAPPPAKRQGPQVATPAWRAELAQLAVGGARLRLHVPEGSTDPRVLGHLHKNVLAPAGALITAALGPPGDGAAEAWHLAVVDRSSLADALAAIGTHAWEAARGPGGQPPPRVVLVAPAWGGKPKGARAARCRAAWEDAGLPAPEVGIEAWCARLAALKRRHAEAGRATGSAQSWRAVYLHDNVPTVGLATVVAHPAEDAGGDTAEYLLAAGAVLQRRLHLRDSRAQMIVFLSPENEIWGVAGAAAPAHRGTSAALWGDFTALPLDGAPG